MTTEEIKRLVIERRERCGMGLCGSYNAISRWLFREYAVIATESWIEQVMKEART